MTFTEEQASKLQRAEEVLGYSFSNKQLILSAITHPSATEGRAVKYSYERLEFLGDSILGAIVADVAFETSDRDAIAAMDGTPGIILQVSKRSGANEVKTAEAVAAAMEELAAKDSSIHYAVPYVASEYINVAVDAALEGIILGVVLAALVVWLFLRRGGATMTIAVSMPVCILAVFVLMYVCDLTLNMMSLGGIAMGVGMIVDNSIIVLENIYRWASEGHDRMTSCVEGTKEVTLSLTASTLTTVAVFLPLGLTGGIAGQIFKDFCLTIAFLILGSLAVAVTLVPLLCYFLLDESKVHLDALQRAQKGGRRAQKLMDWYVKKLDYYVHHLKRGVLVSVALVAVFLAACLNTKMVLLPEMDEGMVTVTVSMPIGSKVEQAAAMAERVAAIAEETIPELAGYYYTADSGQSASLVLNLTDKGERDRSATDIANALRDATYDVAGCEITCSAYDMGAMMGGSGVSVITAAAADGWLRLDVTETDGQTRHVITGDDAVYIWYGSSRKVYSGASALTQDAEQGILTYEDILALPPERIAAADYRALEGVNCIYVETEPDEAGYVERYWVSVSSGLLAAAERECDGAVVYRMAALTVSYDGVDAEDFTLPDGTVLYEPVTAAQTTKQSEND